MMPSGDVENSVRSACVAGDVTGATTLALRAYGAEILGLLVATHHDRGIADEAFSLFAERFWKTLGDFEWKCSLRTWMYRLARNALIDLQRQSNARYRKRIIPISEADAIEELAVRIRTETYSALRSEKRSAFEELRAQLPEDDRLLLMLRVQRNLPWAEIARIFTASEEPEQKAVMDQESARLRKRFQLVKERLRKLAREAGLL
jgi:RNA polymerase sigma-70 factor (ECF subfamily)